ncbi:MAG: C25 family cysteine peptidase [Chloroflexota bacterium]|nr:C25 family cysteine peptidase [Chloroflexota bacterium]
MKKAKPWPRTKEVLVLLLVGTLLTQPIAALAAPPPERLFERQILTTAYEITGQGIHVPGYEQNTLPGAPQLPVTTLLVELPAGTGFDVSFESRTMELIDKTISLPAVPVPDFSPEFATAQALGAWPDYWPEIDRPDPEIYQKDAFYPAQLVTWEAPQRLRGKWLLPIIVYPFQYNPRSGQLRYHPDILVTVDMNDDATESPTPRQAIRSTRNPMMLAGDGALRIRTGERGLYRLTYAELNAGGVPVSTVDPRTFHVFHEGEEIDIQVTGEEDGNFNPGDLVLFYAEPYTGRWQNHDVYQFTYGGAASGARIGERAVVPDPNAPVITTISRTEHVEFDRHYGGFSPRPIEEDHWFDEQRGVNTSTQTISWTYPLELFDPLTDGTAELRAVIHSVVPRPQNPDHYAGLWLNATHVGDYFWDATTQPEIAIEETLPVGWLNNPSNQIIIEADRNQLPDPVSYYLWPDWVEVTYPSEANAQNDRLYIESLAEGANEVQVNDFSTDEVAVYDVRDTKHPVRLETTATHWTGSSYQLSFWDEAQPDPAYMLSAMDADTLLAPLAIEMNELSNWMSPDHSYDYIAVIGSSRTRIGLRNTIGDELSSAVQPLLDHRAAEGFRVAKVDVQDIYDELSFGRANPQAIRDFLTYAYWNWNQNEDPVGYLLLVGDTTLDLRYATDPALHNLIPPYLAHVDPLLGEAPADSRFVSVDGPDDYMPDMAIGRIPANSASEVNNAVTKILANENAGRLPDDDWQSRVWFGAGRCNDHAGNFQAVSNMLRADWLPGYYHDQQVYFGDPSICPQSDANTWDDFNSLVWNAFDQGALYFQWYGHGNTFRWGGGALFGLPEIDGLQPNTNWPMTAHFACTTGYFVHTYTGTQSLGESFLVRHSDRGSVADFSGAGIHTFSAMRLFNQGVIQSFLEDRIERIGDAVNASELFYFQHTLAYHDVIDTMTLFGDPASKLQYPHPRSNSTWLPLVQSMLSYNQQALNQR